MLASVGPHTPDSIISLVGSELSVAVYRTANALLANPADAEEVTLDTLEQLHKKLGELGEAGLPGWINALPSWLDKVAVGKAKGRANKRKRHSGKLAELTLMSEQIGDTVSPNMAKALLVKEVLAYLPGRHRFVFVLKYGLGHGDAVLAELMSIDAATVTRTVGAIVNKLGEYAAHHPIAKAMFDGTLTGGEDNPLRSYIEAFGGPDEATEARIKRRFDTYLRDGPGQLELSGDHSFHDNQLSSSNFRVQNLAETRREIQPEPELEPGLDETPDPDPDPIAMPYQDRRWVAWLVGAAGAIAVSVLAYGQLQMTEELEAIHDELSAHQHAQGVGPAADQGPTMLEPSTQVELAYGSIADPSEDAIVEQLRNDNEGAVFKLSAGSIAIHAKRVEGLDWRVHAGDYTITAVVAGGKGKDEARFRVTHTDSVPTVQVFQGKVLVAGGLLAAEGVEVSSATQTLAAAMEALGDEALAKLAADSSASGAASGASTVDNMYGRALVLRSKDPVAAEALFYEIVELGGDDWITERAFDQLRTMVRPAEREALRLSYVERFPEGKFAEPFGALECQAMTEDEDADTCWADFESAHPDSLYGP